jgi:hypothetical protein
MLRVLILDEFVSFSLLHASTSAAFLIIGLLEGALGSHDWMLLNMFLGIHRVAVRVDGQQDAIPHCLLAAVVWQLDVEEASISTWKRLIRGSGVAQGRLYHKPDIVSLELLAVEGKSLLSPTELYEFQTLLLSHFMEHRPEVLYLNHPNYLPLGMLRSDLQNI